LSRPFCQDQDQGQDFYFQDQDQNQDSGSQDQDQDQDFIFCPRGASRPRLWSRGLHHWFFDVRNKPKTYSRTLRKTGTMGTLPSKPEIGVWIKVRDGRGWVRGDRLQMYIQNPAI